VIIASLLLQGCFQLRQAPLWPAELQPVALQAAATERDFSLQLRQALVKRNIPISQLDAAATVVIGSERVERTVQSLDIRGKADEYLLSYQIELSALDGRGETILPRQDYRDSRSFAYDARQALGLQRQQQAMVTAMRQQAIEALIRRLAMLPLGEGQP